MKGKITISKYIQFEEKNPIHIEVVDGSSLINFVDVKMSLENFSRVITGQGYVECEFEVRGLDLVGKIYEHKDEIVSVPKGWSYNYTKAEAKEIAKELLKPFEVDGWKGDPSYLFNHHYRRENGFQVAFVRYVDPMQN